MGEEEAERERGEYESKKWGKEGGEEVEMW